MKPLGAMTLTEALSEWGVREAAKYSIELPTQDHKRALAGVDVILQRFSLLAARIVLAEPRDVLRVKLDREDGERLQLNDGRQLAAELERLIAGEIYSLDGPLLCTVHVDDAGKQLGPVVIYDGWHRAPRWLVRARAEAGLVVLASLVRTKHALVQISQIKAEGQQA